MWMWYTGRNQRRSGYGCVRVCDRQAKRLTLRSEVRANGRLQNRHMWCFSPLWHSWWVARSDRRAKDFPHLGCSHINAFARGVCSLSCLFWLRSCNVKEGTAERGTREIRLYKYKNHIEHSNVGTYALTWVNVLPQPGKEHTKEEGWAFEARLFSSSILCVSWLFITERW